MKEEVIQFIDVNKLSEPDQDMVKSISEEYHPKIKRMLNNMTSLAVHVKAHSKEGSKAKYSVHIRAIAPTSIIEENHAADWDLARTMHKAFKNIEHQIEHKFKK